MVDESIIRERAYALWEKDACPEGADHFYWYLAQDQLKTSLQLARGECAHTVDDEQVSLVGESTGTMDEDQSN